jgi:cytoskeleton protein RodZ
MAHTGLGPYLKEARERAGMTLDELARRTRIRRQNLESLEKGDWEALPSDLYVRGFVKLVCREFGLSPEKALRLYEESRRETGSAEETVWAEERTVPEPGWLERVLQEPERVLEVARRTGKWAAWGAGGVVVVLLALWVGRRFEHHGEPQGVGRELAAELASPGGAEPSERGFAEDAEPTEQESAAGAESPVQARAEGAETPEQESVPAEEPTERGETRAEQVQAPPERALSPSAEPAPSTGERLEGIDAAETAAEPPPAARERRVIEGPRLAAGERLTLRIEAVREVQISLLLDGVGLPRRRTLAAGEATSWRADSLFLLSTADAGALRLTLAGEDLGPAGADGERLERLAIRASRP